MRPRSASRSTSLAAAALAGVLLLPTSASATMPRPHAVPRASDAPAAFASNVVRAPMARARAGRIPDWPSYHGSRTHAGVSTTMPRVHGALKILRSITLDGAVYGSPIVVQGRTVVVTENNSIYEFGKNFKQLWAVHLQAPASSGELPCGDISPLGITSTPVYSSRTGDVYVSAEIGAPPRHRLYAISLTTGRIRWERNLDLPGADRTAMQQRGALTIDGGRVWASFGALAGDCGDYKGRVVGYRLGGHGSALRFQPSTRRQGGIWNAAGPTVDSRGRLLLVSANGSSFPGDAYDHTNSLLAVSPSGRLLDSFAPRDWATNNQNDVGLGSQGAALVGRKWIVLGGKSNQVYVLRQTRLGGIAGQVSTRNLSPSYGGAAVAGSVVYLPCTDGVRAVRVSASGHLGVLWHAASNVDGSPVVGGGRVWSLDQGAGVLYALSQRTGASNEKISLGSPTSRFATPALYGRRVLVGTMTGLVVVTS